MSIINDALKKAEKDRQVSQDKPYQILSKKVDEIKTDVEKLVLKKWLVWTSAGLVCALGIILVVNSLQAPGDKTNLDNLSGNLTGISTLKGTGTLTGTSEKAQPPKELKLPGNTVYSRKENSSLTRKTSNFNLSGIFYDQQKPLAIINNRIVEKGALIKGAELLEIRPDCVRLSLKGKEFTLKIK